MRCFSKVMQYTKINSGLGSITVEAAIVLPIVLIFMFMFVSFLQYVSVYFMVNKAGNTTAEYMSYYACIYYEQGVEKLGNVLSDKAYKSFGDNGVIISEAVSNTTGNLACSTIATNIFNKEIEEYQNTYIGKLFEIDNISLLKSSFFETKK